MVHVVVSIVSVLVMGELEYVLNFDFVYLLGVGFIVCVLSRRRHILLKRDALQYAGLRYNTQVFLWEDRSLCEFS